jgi:hypothetical protein
MMKPCSYKSFIHKKRLLHQQPYVYEHRQDKNKL